MADPSIPTFTANEELPAAKLTQLADAVEKFYGNATVPLTQTSNGTVTAGTTETPDAVLGTYQFTADPSIRYRVHLYGRGLSMSVANDRFSLKFRYTTDGSTPVAASTQIGHDATVVNPVSGSNGVVQLPLVVTFIPVAAGGVPTVVKVRATWQRVNGTGTGTPVGSCEMWAEAMGNS